MRRIKSVFLVVVALVLIVLALANRGPVTLRLVPDEAAGLVPFGHAIELPLYLVLFLGVFLGLLIGVVWEWIREHRQRAELARLRRSEERLRRQLADLRRQAGAVGERDEILELLEQA